MKEKDLNQVISELNQWGNLNSALQFLVKNICILNDWPYGEVWLLSGDKKFMIWNGVWSKNEDYFENFSKFSSLHKFAKGVGLIGKTWEQKKYLLLDDLTSEDFFLRNEVAEKIGFKSAISIPVLSEDKVISVLCFFKNKLIADDKDKTEKIFQRIRETGNAFNGLL